jgi:hypothetical protein
MNLPYLTNYRIAFEEAVRRGLVRAEDLIRLECRIDRDEIGRCTYERYYVDGQFIFELNFDMLSDDVEVKFAEPARTRHKPNSRLAAHDARWFNVP